MSLDVKVSKKMDYSYVLKLSGSLDSDTYTQLDDELSEIIGEPTKTMVFDMSSLEYISSAGIGVVIKTQRELKGRGATFIMVNLQPQIKKVFDVMKILPIIDIFDDMPEADKYIDQIIKEELAKGKL
jgi:anti-anti-sigma factor